MAKIANAKSAYIEDHWDRSCIEEFGYVLKYFADRAGHDVERFEFTRKFYHKVAEIADDLVIEALLAKKALRESLEKQKEGVQDIDPQTVYESLEKMDLSKIGREESEPSRIAPYVIDDFVEIIIDIKHYGSCDYEMDRLDQEMINSAHGTI